MSDDIIARLLLQLEYHHRNLFGDQHVIFHTEQLPATCPTCQAIRDAKLAEQRLAHLHPPDVHADNLYRDGWYAGVQAVKSLLEHL